MTRWFTLTSATTYNWKSKASGRYYQFVDVKPIAVDHPVDQLRFSSTTNRFVEVDEKGNILNKEDGGTMTRSAFSRRGMAKQPKSYAKIRKTVVPAPVVAPAKPVAPRTVVSSNKTTAPDKPEATPEPTTAPKKAKKARKSRKKASKKSKKSGRTNDE